MWEYESIYDDDLMHYGIKGMKWGIRRKTGPDGTVGGKISKNDKKKKYGTWRERASSSLSKLSGLSKDNITEFDEDIFNEDAGHYYKEYIFNDKKVSSKNPEHVKQLSKSLKADYDRFVKEEKESYDPDFDDVPDTRIADYRNRYAKDMDAYAKAILEEIEINRELYWDDDVKHFDIYSDELYHWGIKGMKWGIRRYQNKDGSLTAAGKKRRSLGQVIHDRKVHKKRVAAAAKARETREKNLKAEAKRKKALERGTLPVKKMTDDELAASIKRLENEQKYAQKVLETSTMRRFMHKTWNDAIVPGVTEGGKALVKDFMIKKGSDLLGLSKKEVESEYDRLKKANDMSNWKKNMQVNEDYFAKRKERIEKEAEDRIKEAEDKATAKAKEKVDQYNSAKEKDRWQNEGRHNMKGDGTSKSVPTDIPGESSNGKASSGNNSNNSGSKATNSGNSNSTKAVTQTVKTSGSTALSTLNSGSGKKTVDEGRAWIEDSAGNVLTSTDYREKR